MDEYEYKVLPFGLMNGPSTFRQLIPVVLHEPSDFAMAYLDNNIIFSQNFLGTHKTHSEGIWPFKTTWLKTKTSKCKFIQDQTQYLGFIISEDDIMSDLEKVRVIKECSYNCQRSKELHWHVWLLPHIHSKFSLR